MALWRNTVSRSPLDGISAVLDIGNVLQIIESAEEIVSHSVLEPTPLGPEGVRSLVHQVHVTENPWHKDDNFMDILHLLLQDTEGTIPHRCVSEPPSKKQCLGDINCWDGGSELGLVLDKDNEGCQMSARFRRYEFDRWADRFQEMKYYRMRHGHCLVPHNCPENQKLVQWVKRQRYQYKLKQLGLHSTLTDVRQTALEEMGGFIWDSHKASWQERYRSFYNFHVQRGHCNVPSNHPNKTLTIWVKCQRRQHKLYKRGERSTMTDERIKLMDNLGFDWNPRNL
jgi:hypothetical protein